MGTGGGGGGGVDCVYDFLKQRSLEDSRVRGVRKTAR